MKAALGISALAAVIVITTVPASAAMMCTDAPAEKWISRDQVAKMFTERLRGTQGQARRLLP